MKFSGDFHKRDFHGTWRNCVWCAVRFIQDLSVFGSHQSEFLFFPFKYCCSIQGLPWNDTPSLRWRAAASRVDGNPADARRGRGVRSVQQIGPRIHPAVLNHIGQEARRICVWLAVKAPQGKREQRIKMREMRNQRRRLQTEKVVLKTRRRKKRKLTGENLTPLQSTTIR